MCALFCELMKIDSIYNWEETSPDPVITKHIKTVLGVPEPIARAMVNRGIITVEQAKSFLNPTSADLHSPWLFRDMEKAADRVVRAIKDNERILVLGDYDVDGISGTALLVMFLEARGGHVKYYIPDRLTEGYGLSKAVVLKAAEAQYDLMITVDSGVSANEEAALAKEKGIDLIITDHHEQQGDLPDALAVINPKIEGSAYPFRGLAGVGVAFKLVLAVAEKMELDIEEVIQRYMQLVTLGTVADLVPLLDENRFIVRVGLEDMPRSRNHGLYSLMQVSHIKESDRLDASHIAFRLAPRINAAGRLWNPRAGVELFREKAPSKAMVIARKLDEKNRLRVTEEARIFRAAEKMLKENNSTEEDRVIILWEDSWHVGVIGIVASKIMERHHKPVLFATPSQRPEDLANPHPEKGRVYQGSARSFKGFDMYGGLTKCSDILISFGGHELAAGVKIYEKDIPELKRRLEELVSPIVGASDFRRSITIDADLKLVEVSRELLNNCRKMEPCGIGNRKPIFRTRGATVLQVRAMGAEGMVLRMKLGQDSITRDAVGFGFTGLFEFESLYGQSVDVVYDIQEDNYGGRSGISLMVKDLRII